MVNSTFLNSNDQSQSVNQSNTGIQPEENKPQLVDNKYEKRGINKNKGNYVNLFGGIQSSRHHYKEVHDRTQSTNNVFPKLDIINHPIEESDKLDPLRSFRSRLSKFTERKFTNSVLRGSN